jgi:hypothetical protein
VKSHVKINKTSFKQLVLQYSASRNRSRKGAEMLWWK